MPARIVQASTKILYNEIAPTVSDGTLQAATAAGIWKIDFGT